jgi:hypothetical protein
MREETILPLSEIKLRSKLTFLKSIYSTLSAQKRQTCLRGNGFLNRGPWDVGEAGGPFRKGGRAFAL